MRSLFFISICVFLLNASTINLNKILQDLKNSHPLAKSINDLVYANNSQSKALDAGEAIKLLTDRGYSKPHLDQSGYEYSIGLEQNFMNPTVKNSILKSASYQGEAEILKLKYDFMILENEVRLLYHTNCLDQYNLEQYKRSLNAFLEIYSKKERAYSYGEISKKDLLSLEIELDRLKGEYNRYESEVEISRSLLQSKALLSLLVQDQLECKDMEQITKDPLFNNETVSLQEESIEKKILSLQSDFNRYNAAFDSFSLSASYQNELDTKKFVVGLTIPLNFTSSLNEQSRSMITHKKSALTHEKEALILQKNSKADALKKRVSQQFEEVKREKNMLDRYELELMPLVEKAYTFGESSAIEYLLFHRELSKIKEELILYRKNYYTTLFELYSVLKSKDQL